MFSTVFGLEFKKKIYIIELPVLLSDNTYTCIHFGDARVVSRRTPTLGNLFSPSYFSSSKTQKEMWLCFKGVMQVSVLVVPDYRGGRNLFLRLVEKAIELETSCIVILNT